MPCRRAITMTDVILAATILVALVVGVVALARFDLSGDEGNRLPPSAEYELEKYKKIDSSLIGYRQTGSMDVEMAEPRTLDVGPNGRFYVAGDRAVAVFDEEGVKQTNFSLGSPPQCAVMTGEDHAAGKRLYVGMKDHVEVYSLDGKRLAAWDTIGPKALVTALVAGEEDLFVADAVGKVILRYDPGGKLLGRIGERNPATRPVGFVVPSPYFDMVLPPDGLLRVVNPGRHTIEAFTVEGHFEKPLTWGRPMMLAKPWVAGFCGCCNPAHLALLLDGRFVTAEKGIPQVKVFSSTGEFECVVAGPETLEPTPTAAEETRDAHRLKPVDVATDDKGRILVLDPAARAIRIFEANMELTEGSEKK